MDISVLRLRATNPLRKDLFEAINGHSKEIEARCILNYHFVPHIKGYTKCSDSEIEITVLGLHAKHRILDVIHEILPSYGVAHCSPEPD